MPAKKKPSLSVSKFIFNASSNEAFRKKYLADPSKLAHEFDMTDSDMADIQALDLKKVSAQIAAFAKLDLLKGDVNLAATHCKDSHTSHTKDAHSNSSHSNGCEDMASLRMNEVVETLRRKDDTEGAKQGRLEPTRLG